MIDGPDGIVEIRLYQGLNVIGAEDVDILPETPCVGQGKRVLKVFSSGTFCKCMQKQS